jgi:hypothetical protein
MLGIRISVLTQVMTLSLFLLSSCGGESPPEQEVPAPDQSQTDTTAVMEVDTDQPSREVPSPVDEITSTPIGPQGTWDTTMGEMELVVGDSGRVSGHYPLGTIQGTIDGHTLEYTYNEGSLSGDGVFEFDADFSTFSGVQDIAGTELVWEGQRI